MVKGVVARLMGGLGNQLFQYAAARTLADRWRSELRVDPSYFDSQDLRSLQLQHFRVRCQSVLPSLSRMLPRRVRGIAGRVALRHVPRFIEPAFSHYERFHDLEPPILLEGYWQTEKYFCENSAQIRMDLSLKHAPPARTSDMERRIRGVNAISMHIRRGDYVTNPTTAAFHGVLPLEYYRAAADIMRTSMRDAHFFVFSDDQRWARQNVDFDAPLTFVDSHDPGEAHLDMWLMSSCRHHIIANSSFSWWGAWLNPRPDKTVIAPKKWFNELRHDDRDLLPAAWIRL